jgi:hypothetical protein
VLTAILGLHFFTRLHTHETMPLEDRHFYPSSYLVSLALLSGGGFNYLYPNHDPASAELYSVISAERKPGDPAAAVMDFIAGRGRGRLSSPELAAYLSSGAHVVPAAKWEASRTLDIYSAAVIWRLFGISWTAYFVFYSLFSTIADFAVFLIALRLTGSYWCGLAGAVGFLASPLENYAAIWSPRDTNPLWFAALAFLLLVRCTTTPHSLVGLWSSSFALGGLSFLGTGWRQDSQLLPPFMLGALITLRAMGGLPKRRIASAALGFLAGYFLLGMLIGSLKPRGDHQGEAVFHVAWYGEHTRGNLLGLENAFQVARDDTLTVCQSNYFGRQRGMVPPGSMPNRDPFDALHFRRCFLMYLEMLRYNAFSWWVSFPEFLLKSTAIDRLPTLGNTEGSRFLKTRLSWLQPAYGFVLEPYGAVTPFLFIVGLVSGLLRDQSRGLALLLSLYFVYYAAALFLVLPEWKHMAHLLLPLHALSAVGLWSIVRAVGEPHSWRGALRRFAGPGKWLLAVVGIMTLTWGLITIASGALSRRQRRGLIDSIVEASVKKEPVALDLSGKRQFSIKNAGEGTLPVGYLLRIAGGATPEDLLCIHVRESAGLKPALAYYTRHRLSPNREQFFFVNVSCGREGGDERPYTLSVIVRGGARILSGRQIDLAGWSIGLPLSFVFEDDNDEPRNSFIGEEREVTAFFEESPETQLFFRKHRLP